MSESTTQTTAPTETKKTKTPKKAAAPNSKPAKAVTPKKEKPAKEAKPQVEKPPREDRSDWQTFALRLPRSESAALHAHAGAANASRAVRSLIAAFIAENPASFAAVVEDCKKLR